MSITSEIANLIQHGGEIQAHGDLQRGQVWGNFLTNLAGVPAQIQRAKTERQEQQVRQLELTERQRQLQSQQQLRGVLTKYGGDLEKALPEVMQIDPSLGMQIQDRATAARSRALEYQTMQLTHQQKELEFQSQLIGSASDEPSYQEAVLAAKHAGLDVSKLPPTYDQRFVEGVQKAGLTAKEQLGLKMQAIDDQRQELARQDAAKKNAAVETETARHNKEMEQRQHELALAEIANKGTDNQRAAAAAEETARHNKAIEGIDRARLAKGDAADRVLVPIIGPDGKSVLVPRAQAVGKTPASADRLVKVEHKDPQTGKTVIEWLPQSDVRGQTFEKGTGATTENRIASAVAVNQTGEDIIAKLSDPAFRDAVGPLMGRASTLREFIGNPPPEFSELAGAIESYALANMGVHGMRSAQGAEQIKKLLDAHHTPASLIAAIKGLNAFSAHFIENEGRQVPGAPKTTAPAGEWIDAGNGLRIRKK